MSKEFKSRRFKKFKLIIIFVLIIFSVYTLPATRYPLSLYTLHPTRYTLESVAYAGTGITNTKHDLSAAGPGPIKAQTETQKCVFCHTPHHSSTAGPLWNRNLSTTPTYIVPSQAEWPSLLSGEGKPVEQRQPDRGAKLCLSCHDGTVAIGSVLNMPGTGMAGTIAMTQDYITPGMTGYIGIDISGHHPVSIAYNDDLYNDKKTQCNNCQSALPINPPASVTPPVKLRPTDNTYKGAGGLGVQCSSCHDPHNNSYGKFLVIDYDGENLCYACHYKCMATCE